jgi:carboxypeptidase PM20D1
MIKGAEATKKVDMNSKGYLYLTEMIKRIFPDVGIAPYVITGRTDAREFEEISDCTIRFAPTRMTNEDLKGIHGINESVAINSVIEAIHFYKELLKNYQE